MYLAATLGLEPRGKIIPTSPEQINLRVTPELYDILEAAAFVRRLRGAQELLRPEVEALAERWAREPEVKRALQARAERDAKIGGKLARISRDEGG